MVIRLPKWLLLSICAFSLSQGNKAINSLFEYSKNIEILTALYTELGTHYVDEIEPGTLIKTGIDAMLTSLDPYTHFFSEYQAEEALMERQGQYGGVGCSVLLRGHYPVVTNIQDGYAFDKADVHLGDVITHINGIHLRSKPIEELLTLFRGSPNTSFSLALEREGKPLEKSILRMAVKTPSVAYSGLLEHRIAYIKLEEFNEHAAEEIAQSLKKMMENVAILDASLNSRFTPEMFGGKKSQDPVANKLSNPLATDADELNQVQTQPWNYYDFSIPWSLNINYNISYNAETSTRMQRINNHRVSVNGDIGITPEWKISYQTGYDVKRKEIASSEFSIARNLHCWQLEFHWIPSGYGKQWMFTLRPKSSLLQDLKLNKRIFSSPVLMQ